MQAQESQRAPVELITHISQQISRLQNLINIVQETLNKPEVPHYRYLQGASPQKRMRMGDLVDLKPLLARSALVQCKSQALGIKSIMTRLLKSDLTYSSLF